MGMNRLSAKLEEERFDWIYMPDFFYLVSLHYSF
jgi:hypothetical protein